MLPRKKSPEPTEGSTQSKLRKDADATHTRRESRGAAATGNGTLLPRAARSKDAWQSRGSAPSSSAGGKRRGSGIGSNGNSGSSGLLRAAIVLHGKLGSIDRGQGWTRAVDGAAPTVDLAVSCYASIVRHLVEANRDEATVDLFGHSWSPEVGAVLDALFLPRASAHEAEPRDRNRQLCFSVSKMLRERTSTGTPGAYGAQFAHYAAVGRGANSCERTANHLLGMQRAIALKARYERERGYRYDIVVVSRWDVLWSRPLRLAQLDLSAHAFTVPTFCTHARGVDHKSELERGVAAFRRAVCGGDASVGQVPTASTACHPSHRPCAPDLSARARELYLLDWWFASDSAAADAFGAVAEPALFSNYTLLNQQHLNGANNARPTIMGHAYWGLHMVWGLRAPLRFQGMVGHDFSLGRAYGRTGCRGLRPNCASPSCTAADVVRRPWHTMPAGGAAMPAGGAAGAGLPPLPERPALTFAYGGAETRYSCGEGYFTCGRSSRMCKEDEATWEPMDRDLGRRAWIACTAGICTRAGANKYSARCAGALLGAWTAVWKHLPPANTNLSTELRDAGAYAGSALGWSDPARAHAALAELTTHAGSLYRSSGAPATLSLHQLLTECTDPIGALSGAKAKGKGSGGLR